MLAVYHLCTNPKNKIDIAARYQVTQVVLFLLTLLEVCDIKYPINVEIVMLYHS
jgi:hypothetical protein